MIDNAVQLCEQGRHLLQQIKCCKSDDPRIAACGILLAAAIDAEPALPVDGSRLRHSILNVAILPMELQRVLFNGWVPDFIAPEREDILTRIACGEVRRVLTIEVTDRTMMPSLGFTVRQGDAPVRIEIAEGTPLDEVKKSMAKVMALVGVGWDCITSQETIGKVSDQLLQKDMRTADSSAL